MNDKELIKKFVQGCRREDGENIKIRDNGIRTQDGLVIVKRLNEYGINYLFNSRRDLCSKTTKELILKELKGTVLYIKEAVLCLDKDKTCSTCRRNIKAQLKENNRMIKILCISKGENAEKISWLRKQNELLSKFAIVLEL